MRILIVEDNQKLAGYIKKALEQKSYSVDCVFDGAVGEQRVLHGDYDAMVLDIMLPTKDGVAVCQDLRQANANLPIILLTARGEASDIVQGLDSGADDYLVKPFELEELLARIRALLRRPPATVGETLAVQDIVINLESYVVTQGGSPLLLTRREYAVLEYLMRNQGRPVTREQILEHCWDFAFDSFSNIVDVYIKQLRQKLHDYEEHYIKTIRGVGYQIQA
ncbi:MAG: response regulator transcription factor [Candidatus Moraniibacteriota bacterium]